MARRSHTRSLYRDPRSGVLGGVCAGIAEYLNVDVLLVRVVALVALVMTCGLITALYLVFWTVLPLKVSRGAFVDIEPRHVQSERYDKVITVRSNKLVSERPAVKVIEQGSPEMPHSRKPRIRLAAYRFPFLVFIVFCLLVTLFILFSVNVSKSARFEDLLPLYFIPLGIFLVTAPSSSRTIVVRICMMILCFEACVVFLPFTIGLCSYESLALLQGSTFMLWIVALIFMIGALVFENTVCYLIAIVLILGATIASFFDFGFLDPMVLLLSFA